MFDNRPPLPRKSGSPKDEPPHANKIHGSLIYRAHNRTLYAGTHAIVLGLPGPPVMPNITRLCSVKLDSSVFSRLDHFLSMDTLIEICKQVQHTTEDLRGIIDSDLDPRYYNRNLETRIFSMDNFTIPVPANSALSFILQEYGSDNKSSADASKCIMFCHLSPCSSNCRTL